ncbi:hypothetical protein ACFL0V_00465 [Nanoarchaeota archaeon]
MEIHTVKKVFYWSIYGIFMIILLFSFSSKISAIVRIILILLLAFISARYKFDNTFIATVITVTAAIITGIIMSNSKIQFWLFAILFIVTFYASDYVWKNDLLGV